jgi:hypothetical protein
MTITADRSDFNIEKRLAIGIKSRRTLSTFPIMSMGETENKYAGMNAVYRAYFISGSFRPLWAKGRINFAVVQSPPLKKTLPVRVVVCAAHLLERKRLSLCGFHHHALFVRVLVHTS